MKRSIYPLSRCFRRLFAVALMLLSPAINSAGVADKLVPMIDLVLNAESHFERVLRNYNDRIVDDYVYIAAHRGGKENDEADQAPGNSIANIANAVSKGFDVYESDIEILLGGDEETLVVFHDNFFNNLTNTLIVDEQDLLDDADLAYANTLKLRYDNGNVSDEGIPTLESFLRAAKGKIIVKFDLKSGVFSTARLTQIFETIKQTGTTKQVLIRGGQYVLDTAFNNMYDTQMVMLKYDTEPSNEELMLLRTKYNAKAISIPNGSSAATILNAKNAGILVEIHELQGTDDQAREEGWDTAIAAGVRQFHSFKPTLLKQHLESTIYRELR